MPVDFLQLKHQVSEMGARARDFHNHHEDLLQKAVSQMKQYALRGDDLCTLVEQTEQSKTKLRCAVPTQPEIMQTYEAQACSSPGLILAADGSQINPSRHDPFPICVINVGVLEWIPGSTPQEVRETELLYYDRVLTRQGLLTEGMVGLKRDLKERSILAQLAVDKPQPVLALTDGPLELFTESHESQEFQEALKSYLTSLKEMEKLQAITAGYVDKPMSDLVVRLLELTLSPEEVPLQTDRRRPLLGIADKELFRSFLKPGQRSAVFSIHSQQTAKYTGGLALHFFYLNTGRENHPALARVDIPAWVAENPSMLNLLHQTLLEQCAQMGTIAYPYCLRRAHEIAVVSFEEKAKIFEMITGEYLSHGIPVDTGTFKQQDKDLNYDRKRYQ
jgi:hypothetical protein